jgi:hypothetical protein
MLVARAGVGQDSTTLARFVHDRTSRLSPLGRGGDGQAGRCWGKRSVVARPPLLARVMGHQTKSPELKARGGVLMEAI